jgi:hypothetical protein
MYLKPRGRSDTRPGPGGRSGTSNTPCACASACVPCAVDGTRWFAFLRFLLGVCGGWVSGEMLEAGACDGGCVLLAESHGPLHCCTVPADEVLAFS